MELNKYIATRDKLIFGKYRPNRYKFGNSANFKGLNASILSQLIDEYYLNPLDNCGDTTVDSIRDFVEKHYAYTVHGYTTLENMVIEGVEKGSTNDTVEEFQDYMELFRNFKHFDSATMYCSV